MRITTIEQAGFPMADYVSLYNLIFCDYPFPLTISESRLQRQLTNGILEPRYCLVAEEAGKLVGLLLVAPPGADHQVHLQALGVIPEARRSGVGKALLEDLKAKVSKEGITRLQLMVLQSNHRAKAFYRQMGFTLFSSRDCYLLNLPARFPKGNSHLSISRMRQEPWPQDDHAANSDLPITTVLMAEAGEEVVGHLVYSGEEVISVESLYVMPEWRRRRVASTLLRAALAASPLTKKIRLNYLPRADRGARRFLRRLGFCCYCRLEEMICSLP